MPYLFQSIICGGLVVLIKLSTGDGVVGALKNVLGTIEDEGEGNTTAEDEDMVMEEEGSEGSADIDQELKKEAHDSDKMEE